MASGRFPGLGVQGFTPQRLSAAFPPACAGSGIIETGSPITVAGPRRLCTDFPFSPWIGYLKHGSGQLVSEAGCIVKHNTALRAGNNESVHCSSLSVHHRPLPCNLRMSSASWLPMTVQDLPSPGSVEGQRAGVVAYRQEPDGAYEILIITARRQPDAWIFPVGKVDPGETLEQAAARECMEESGYTVRCGPLLKALDLAHKNGARRFSFFAAQVTGEVDEYETDRSRRWVPLAQLVETVSEVFAPVARAALAHLSA